MTLSYVSTSGIGLHGWLCQRKMAMTVALSLSQVVIVDIFLKLIVGSDVGNNLSASS
jgi:hypothetical protein